MEEQGCLTCRQARKKDGDSGQPRCNKCLSRGFPAENASTSFSADIVSSASGLLRDALAPIGNQVGATLSQALYEGGKAGPSSSVAVTAPSSTFQATPRPKFAVAAGVTSENDTFRSSVRPPNAPREAFEGVTIDQFLQSEPEAQGYLVEEAQPLFKGKKAVYTTPNGNVTHSSHDTDFVSAWHSGNVEKGSQGRETTPLDDGDEVVNLLTDTSFQPGLWTEDDHDEPYTVTEQEMQIAQWFTQKTREGESKREQLQRAVAAARSGRAFQDFACIFDEVESYHEDVWGYVGPLVEAARQECRVAEPTSSGDGPAVHRLRMIIAHLQAPVPRNSTSHLS